MECLLSCYIWVAGTAYPDTCPGKVKVIYTTDSYYYVSLIQGPTVEGNSPHIEMNTHHQVSKSLCTEKLNK